MLKMMMGLITLGIKKRCEVKVELEDHRDNFSALFCFKSQPIKNIRIQS